MSQITIYTKSGGAILITDASMFTPNSIIGVCGGQPIKYEIQDGDTGSFS